MENSRITLIRRLQGIERSVQNTPDEEQCNDGAIWSHAESLENNQDIIELSANIVSQLHTVIQNSRETRHDNTNSKRLKIDPKRLEYLINAVNGSRYCKAWTAGEKGAL